MTIQKWPELSRKPEFSRFGRGIDRVDYRLPTGETADYYIKVEGLAAVALALTASEEVVLARQFRPGPNAILDELPGGYIDEGETPLEAATRELREETGYAGDMQSVGTHVLDAYSESSRHCFVATDCIKVAEPTPLPGEHTETVLVPLPEFRKRLLLGQMSDIAASYMALDFLKKL